MDDCVERVGLEYGFELCAVAGVYDLKSHFLSGYLLNSGNRVTLGVGKIVDNNYVITGINKLDGGVRANIARTA